MSGSTRTTWITRTGGRISCRPSWTTWSTGTSWRVTWRRRSKSSLQEHSNPESSRQARELSGFAVRPHSRPSRPHPLQVEFRLAHGHDPQMPVHRYQVAVPEDVRRVGDPVDTRDSQLTRDDRTVDQ